MWAGTHTREICCGVKGIDTNTKFRLVLCWIFCAKFGVDSAKCLAENPRCVCVCACVCRPNLVFVGFGSTSLCVCCVSLEHIMEVCTSCVPYDRHVLTIISILVIIFNTCELTCI